MMNISKLYIFFKVRPRRMSAFPKIPSLDAYAGQLAKTLKENFQDLVETAYSMFVVTYQTFPRTRQVNLSKLNDV